MFEKFKEPTGQELSPKDQDVIDAVMRQVPATSPENNGAVVPDGPDDNKHPVRTTADVIRLRDEGENPHGFKEAA